MSASSQSLPEAWDRVDEAAAYTKFVKRDAVQVPKMARGEPFDRDAVIFFTEDVAAIVKGPGARRSYSTSRSQQVASRFVEVVDDWIDGGGDPYGGSELNERLDTAAKSVDDEASLVESPHGA